MMKRYFLILAVSIIVITGCETNTASRSASNSNTTGTYVLTSLVADVAVDFNQDGVFNTQLLNEAVCFSAMDVTFMSNGDFTSAVAIPDFDSSNSFSCSNRTETGTFLIDANDVLTVNVNVNGGTVSESKQLSFTTTTFDFTVTNQELNRYISNRTGTPASGITSLHAVFTKI